MTSPEEALEAAIWRTMTYCSVTCHNAGEFVAAIMLAAQVYAASDNTIATAARRAILEAVTVNDR